MNTYREVWEDCSDVRSEIGEERWIRKLSDKCWISVLYRMTGFGYMEWETALVFLHPVKEGDPRWKDRDLLIIAGDRRDELSGMPEDKLRQWYADNIDGNRNSMETIMEALKS